MAHSEVTSTDIRDQHPLWDEHNTAGRRAMLTEILAQVSHEALQGDTLEAVLQAIVDCATRRLPVTIASIILLNDEGTHFVQEVWSGRLDLALPGDLPWPVSIGVAGRCVRSGAVQLIADVQSDADYVPGNCEVNSEYIVPIRHRGRLHGVLNLESTRRDFFVPEVCAVFDAIADQIAGAIHLARVVRELEQANQKLQQLSMSDGLTGIANRRCFDRRLQEEWQRHVREQQPLALLLIDVDCFKALNDASGHLYGDECLRELARLCSAALRDGEDLVARYGGDELALLLPRCELDQAMGIAKRLREEVQARAMAHPCSPVAAHVTVSIGVSAVHPHGPLLAEALIAASDSALYAAKQQGRNRIDGRAPAGAGT
jgi:diguanylate cyclase (GGDEF)-like protein